MSFGYVELELAVGMITAFAAAAGCSVWAWSAGRQLAGEDKSRWVSALMLNTPALVVAGIDIVMLLACFTLPGSPRQANWDAFLPWLMYGGLLVQPVATLIALVGFLGNWRGRLWKQLAAMKVSTLAAATLTWLGTMANMPTA